MILNEVLELARFNKNTYTALARDAGGKLPFMELATTSQGRDKFTILHPVALRCAGLLMESDVPGRRAIQAVSETFDAIGHKVAELVGHPTRFQVPDWLYVESYGTAGWGYQTGEAPQSRAWELLPERTIAATGRFSLVAISIRKAFEDVRANALERSGLSASAPVVAEGPGD